MAIFMDSLNVWIKQQSSPKCCCCFAPNLHQWTNSGSKDFRALIGIDGNDLYVVNQEHILKLNEIETFCFPGTLHDFSSNTICTAPFWKKRILTNTDEIPITLAHSISVPSVFCDMKKKYSATRTDTNNTDSRKNVFWLLVLWHPVSRSIKDLKNQHKSI